MANLSLPLAYGLNEGVNSLCDFSAIPMWPLLEFHLVSIFSFRTIYIVSNMQLTFGSEWPSLNQAHMYLF
jgi:hypothetical protein